MSSLSIVGTELARLFNVSPQQMWNTISKLDLQDDEHSWLVNNRRYYSPEAARKILLSRGYSFQPTSIAIANCKGGVGKTTLSTALSIKSSTYGFKTLFIDADKQANATERLWPESVDQDYNTLVDVIRKDCSFESLIKKPMGNDFFHLIPSNIDNQILQDLITVKKINIGKWFKTQIENLPYEYDLIVFDLEPSLSHINTMAYCFADRIITPSTPTRDSVRGVEILMEYIEEQSEQWDELKNKQINSIMNSVDGRSLNKVLERSGMLMEIGAKPLNTLVRIDSAHEHAQETGKLKRNSKADEDISNLVQELLNLHSIAKKQKRVS